MRHTNRQESTAPVPKRHKLDHVHKMEPKGKLHSHDVEHKKAGRIVDGSKEVGMPHGIKTPAKNMPNKHLAHHPGKKVAHGSHSNAGGTGHARKAVASEQNSERMFMARKAKANAKKRQNA